MEWIKWNGNNGMDDSNGRSNGRKWTDRNGMEPRTHKPFTLALPIFQTATLPEGMNQEQAEAHGHRGDTRPGVAPCEAFYTSRPPPRCRDSRDAQELANSPQSR